VGHLVQPPAEAGSPTAGNVHRTYNQRAQTSFQWCRMARRQEVLFRKTNLHRHVFSAYVSLSLCFGQNHGQHQNHTRARLQTAQHMQSEKKAFGEDSPSSPLSLCEHVPTPSSNALSWHRDRTMYF